MSEPQQKTEWEEIHKKNLDKVRTATLWGQDGTQIYVGNLIFEVIEDCKALLSQSNINTLEEAVEKIKEMERINKYYEKWSEDYNIACEEVLSTLQELKSEI